LHGRLGVSRLRTDEQQTFRKQSSEIRDVFGRWLTAACAAGVRFVVLEGLMRSGKSCWTEQPFALGMSQSVNIELDGFLRKPVNPDTKYMDAIDVDAASARIIEAYRTAPLVIAEGPMAWPVVRRVLHPPRDRRHRSAAASALAMADAVRRAHRSAVSAPPQWRTPTPGARAMAGWDRNISHRRPS
jgi:hypothetical protein